MARTAPFPPASLSVASAKLPAAAWTKIGRVAARPRRLWPLLPRRRDEVGPVADVVVEGGDGAVPQMEVFEPLDPLNIVFHPKTQANPVTERARMNAV